MFEPTDLIGKRNEVQLVDVAGGWIVRVVQQGREASHKSFERKQVAVAYAEAERERLGIEKVTRI